jgi:rare lipoprotein A
VKIVVASWYGEQYHGKLMSNSRPFDIYKDTIAHRDLPLGTRVQIENPAMGKVVEAKVTDRGTFISRHDIDLSYRLAKKLSAVEIGVSKLLTRVL